MSLLLKEPWSSTGATAAWTSTSGGSTEPSGRHGYGYHFDSATHYVETVSSANQHTTFIVGYAVEGYGGTRPVDDTNPDDNGFISFWGDAGATCHIYVGGGDLNNKLRVFLGNPNAGSPTVLAASTNNISAIFGTGFDYLEVKCVLSATAGSVEVRVNGTTVVSYTGNTKNGGTATVLDTIKLGGFAGSNSALDDLYFFNGAGTSYNDFNGDPGDVTYLGSSALSLSATITDENSLSGTLATPWLLHTATLTDEQQLSAAELAGVPIPLGNAAVADEQTLSATVALVTPLATWTGDDDVRFDDAQELTALLWLEPVPVDPPATVTVATVTTAQVIMPAPTLDATGKPTNWTGPAESYTTHNTWGNLQVIIAGNDVTYFRGIPTEVVSWSSNEPFGDADAVIDFPQITTFDNLGAGDLSWWQPGAEVTIRKRNGTTYKTLWEGILVSEEPNGTGVQMHCLGVLYWLDLQIKSPDFVDVVQDIGRKIPNAINDARSRKGIGVGYCRQVTTGQVSRERGTGSPLLTGFVQDVLAQSGQDTSGHQWTLALAHPRTPVVQKKDVTTTHWSVTNGAPGVNPLLSKDYTQAENAIYGTGTDGACTWGNYKFPNLHADATPDFPLTPPAVYNAGDGQGGFYPFAVELRNNGYDMASRDTYSSADVDEVERFQSRAGITVDGIVGRQTWNAAFQPGSHQGDLTGVWQEPLYVDSTVQPYTYNAQGAKTGENPAFVRGKLRVERYITFGDRVSKTLAIKSAKQMVARDKNAGYAGTVDLETDPEEGSRFEITAGQNLKVKAYHGHSPLTHIARCDVDWRNQRVTVTVDEKARDLVPLATVVQRRKDVTDPAGRPVPTFRSSNVRQDSTPWACEDGAGVIPLHQQQGGLWSVLRWLGSEDQQIARAMFAAGTGLTQDILDDLTADPLPDSYADGYAVPGAVRFALCISAKPITPNQLQNLMPSGPITNLGSGDNPWQAYANTLARWGVQYALGGPGQAAGFYPKGDPGDGSATGLSGIEIDAGGFPLRSGSNPSYWIAIWTAASCYFGGRLFPAPFV